MWAYCSAIRSSVPGLRVLFLHPCPSPLAFRRRPLRVQVNTAARMETTSEPGRVHLSEAAAGALKRLGSPDFGIVSRGERMIKGKVGRPFLF